jgi:pteridine reductase
MCSPDGRDCNLFVPSTPSNRRNPNFCTHRFTPRRGIVRSYQNLQKTGLDIEKQPKLTYGTNMSEKKVAWITGSGAPRVGQVIANHFAAHGFQIALHANTSVENAAKCATELNRTGTETIIVQGAIEDPEFARTSVQRIVSKFGRLDVLVNSAAIWDWRSLEETTAADIQQQFQVNTLGTFLCSQAAGLQMTKQQDGGAIVLIGDWAVHRPYPDFAAYFAGKGAIETMTRSLAVELATRNPAVRVNAILPGPVMMDESISAEKAKTILEQSLLKRQGKPEDVAQAAYFLATQEFITGVCLPVDGGRSIYAGHSTDAIAHPTFHP